MATVADYDKVHRELWPEQRVVEEVYVGCPTLGLINKQQTMGYDGKHIALQYGRNQGRSRSFTTAQANVSANTFEKFFVTSVDDYAVFELTGKLIRSNVNPSASFLVDAMERETRGAMEQIKRSLCVNLLGDGTGTRGEIAAASGLTEGGGETVIALKRPADVKNFEPGMNIVAASTATGSLRDSGTSYPIVGVDLLNGTVTVTGTAATTSSWANDDFLFMEGDASNGGTGLPMLAGLRAWVPDTAPSSGESFFTVDRSDYPQQLAGWRFAPSDLGSTTTIRDTILKSYGVMSRMGQKVRSNAPKTIIMNGEDYTDFLDELDSHGTWCEPVRRQGNGVELFYDGIAIQTAIGRAEIFQDDQQEAGRCFAINPSTWTLDSIGPAPAFAEEDGLRLMRKASADTYEGRLYYHAQVYCDAPLFNANIQLP